MQIISSRDPQVLYLFCVETVNTACDMAIMFQPLIDRFGMWIQSYQVNLLIEIDLLLPQAYPRLPCISRQVCTVFICIKCDRWSESVVFASGAFSLKHFTFQNWTHSITEPILIVGDPPFSRFTSDRLAFYYFQVLISTPIQLFFAWRIYLLTKSSILAIIVAALALTSFGGRLRFPTLANE